MELLLGLDIGTSSSKGVLVSPDGTVVARAERAHATSYPRPGWAEHDPEAVWWADTVAICRELTNATTPEGGHAGGPTGGQIAGVCVSGIGPCLLPVAADGSPLRPAILYGIDTRAHVEIAELTERFGAEAILRRCGSALSSQAVGPKLAWLRRHEPDVWARTAGFHMASSFIVHRLTGAYVLDHHSASQCDPLYDLAGQDWAEDWAAEVAPGLRLPELRWPAEVVGTVSPAAAAATGLPAGTPVTAGTIDAWAEAHSVAATAPGDVMVMYGTTLFVIAGVTQPRPDPALWSTVGLEPDSRCLAGGMATSGALTQWVADLAGGKAHADLLAAAARLPAGAEGLLVLPYFAGERTPLYDPDARGLILGLTMRHGAAHLYRAVLEATGYGLRHILEALAEAGARPRRLVAVGGGTRQRLWPQIVADITGMAQEVPRERIGACFGDAHLAGIGVGLARDPATWNDVEETVEPDEAVRDRYEHLYQLYRSLYPATRAQAHALARLQNESAAPGGRRGGGAARAGRGT